MKNELKEKDKIKTDSLKVNFMLNIFRMFLGIFFLLITTPYKTRVLGSESLGKVEYAISIISYFLLFTALGVPNYGIREIARVRDDKKNLTIVTIELLIILFITTVIGYCILLYFIKTQSIFQENKKLLLILSLNLIFTNIGLNWFYVGIENQIYITKKSVLIQVLSLIGLFLFVKNPEDFYNYAIITVLMASGSNIFNIINIRKYISLKNICVKDLNVKRHLKYILIIFTSNIAISIYLNLDTVMLGSMVNVKSVAYYSVANKLVKLALFLVTALGSIMIPRVSNSLKNGDKQKYLEYMDISFKYILFLGIPFSLGIYYLSEEIILIIAGNGFKDAILTLKLISIIILIVGIAHFIAIQVLFTNGKEKYHTAAVTIAAIINFIFNYTFIPKYAQNGAAIGTVLAEIIGLVIILYLGKKYIKEVGVIKKENLKYLLASIPMVAIIILSKNLLRNEYYIVGISLIFGGGSYILFLFLLKEKLIILSKEFLFYKLKKNE